MLDLVELSGAADRRVGGFSLGMRQRLALATALLTDPEVLILDEPANGLDPEGVRWLRNLLRGLAAEGTTVLVSSHMLAEVAQTVDSVVIVDRGRLVAQSGLAELTAGGPTSRTSSSASLGRPASQPARRPPGGFTMMRQIRVELLKLRTTRLSYGLLAAAAALTALFAVLNGQGRRGGSTAVHRDRPHRPGHRGRLGHPAGRIFGVTVSSGEFRHCTATLTYLAQPHRRRS